MSKKTRVLKKSTLFLDKLKNLCYNKKKKEKQRWKETKKLKLILKI